jgi:glycosyltransferase involved in cell wall biosynthesis
MPRAMLEAASSGRPLVVSDVPGCRQFLRDGLEGFLVPPGDPHALAQQIARLAADPELRARLGAAARRRLLENYTTDAVRRSIRDIYALATLAPST